MRTLFLCLLATAAVALAQDNPLSTFNKMAHGHVKMILLRSAEKLPEENFIFKPTDFVRSYGQVQRAAALNPIACGSTHFQANLIAKPTSTL